MGACQENPLAMENLTPLEQKLVASHSLLTVRGKRGTPVPILIPSDCLGAIRYLADKGVRQQLGIRELADDWGNHYLFANSGMYKLGF